MDIVSDVSSSKAQLLDVRTKLEWKMGHAKGAVHISLNDVLAGKTTKLDPNKPIYIYCASGGRAGIAEGYLRQKGFTTTNIGGLTDWRQSGGAIER